MAKKQSRKSKMGVVVAVLLLAVGFAAVTTTLYINGTIKIVPDTEDFEKNVFFSSAALDYSLASREDVAEITYTDPTAQAVTGTSTDTKSSVVIEQGGKAITFATDSLNTIGESVTLSYKVMNKSQYKAALGQLTCKQVDGAGSETEATPADDHITVTESATNSIVLNVNAESTANTVEVKLVKSYVGKSETVSEADETKTIYIRCELPATAQEASAS